MATRVLKCCLCEYETPDLEAVAAAAILNIHATVHQQAAIQQQQQQQPSRGPKLERPKVKLNATSENWNAFIRRWQTFKSGSNISDNIASGQLLECASEELGNIALRAYPDFTTKPIDEATRLLKSLAVIPVAQGVLRSELTAMIQGADEPFRTFAARVQGKAETCELKTLFTGTCAECNTPYNGETYYTDEKIKDVLLSGIADLDIRREALSADNILNRPINEVIAFVEMRETARNASPAVDVSALSSYRRQQKSQTYRKNRENRGQSPSAADKSSTAPCPDCGKHFHIFTQKTRGWNKKPHERCEECWKRNIARKDNSGDASAIDANVVDRNPFGHVSAITTEAAHGTQTKKRRRRRGGNRASQEDHVGHRDTGEPVPGQQSHDETAPGARRRRRHRHDDPMVAALSHHIFSKGEWRRAQLRNHPRVKLTVTPTQHPSGTAIVEGLADSGAQSDVWSFEQFINAGNSPADLRPVTLSLNAANKSAIRIDGAFFGKITGSAADGSTISHKSMIYVSKDVRGFYLSYETMLELGMISKNFPTPGCALPQSSSSTGEVRAINAGCANPTGNDDPCDCPARTSVPERPTELPFTCTPENNEKMKAWLLERFSGSTFNTCPHRPLPSMSGPPLEIHVDEDAEPYVCHKAASIPIHWQKQVHDELLRDERLGVIERVPEGVPVTWLHKMALGRRHNGGPRRAVDMSRLNKHCKRETHSGESPFHVARRVPAGTWKSVIDAWNGFHSVLLRETDRHLTTFLTPWGRWRYKRAVQGYKSSGDGYNRRMDAILSNFERKERIVDDTLHYDTDLEEHWWRTIDLLITTGKAGMVLNPDKFQFAQRQVDFAGFQISDTNIEPLPKYFNAIRDFPTPKSTTDIKAWFGLINQVANYAQLRDHLTVFRPFLSPSTPFEWTSELEDAFNSSKGAIIDAIKEGLEIFDPKRRTCLRTDWSTKGIGYFLLQQHCNCASGLPNCCPNGWRITLAGSRFLQDAEQRYAPVEGEALSVAWSLEQSRYFTLGCDNLIVVTDHKPLTKLLGDRMLDEIRNTRLFRLKQRTLPWFFHIVHLPGKSNCAADAASRYPSHTGTVNLLETDDLIESAIMASIKQSTSDFSIPWKKLADESQKDPQMKALLDCIQSGFRDEHRHDPLIKHYWKYRDALYELDGVVLYDDRVVVPPSLRHHILNTFHSAHQGVSSMEARARATTFWHGMTNDIDRVRQACSNCVKTAPSQPKLLPAPLVSPSTPFESIVADFFACSGHHYLVIADRLSAWPDIFQCTPGSAQSGAEGLIGCLRNCFACFGVPEELSSDGGPEFVADSTQRFLKRWGVHHRVSSAYHPQSNGRAEVAVKSAKRLLQSNIGPSGSLNTDNFLKAMLQLRNTPDPDCYLSPAQVVFGRPLRDSLAFVNRLEKYSNPNIRPTWREAWSEKESALRQRYHRTAEALNEHSRALSPLHVGDRCYIQNQAGNYPKRWDRSGIVVESPGHDSYIVKVDGAGRVTRRNRRFLRKFVPVSPTINSPIPFPDVSSEVPVSPTINSPIPFPDVSSEVPISSCVTTTNPPSVEMAPPPPTIRSSGSQSETPQDVQTQSDEMATPTCAEPTGQSEGDGPLVSSSAENVRPKRATRRPLKYEPVSGKWVP